MEYLCLNCDQRWISGVNEDSCPSCGHWDIVDEESPEWYDEDDVEYDDAYQVQFDDDYLL